MKLFQAITVLRSLRPGDILTLPTGECVTVLAEEPLKESRANQDAILVGSPEHQKRIPVLTLKEGLVGDVVQHYPALVGKVALKAGKPKKVYLSRTRRELSQLILGLVGSKDGKEPPP